MHIHRFYVDIHGYIHINRCLADIRYMYSLNVNSTKHSLFQLEYDTILTQYSDTIFSK